MYRVYGSGRAVVAVLMLMAGMGAPTHGLDMKHGLDMNEAGRGEPPTPYGVIAGQVVAAGSGEAVAVAQVRLLELRRSQTADADGRFRFRNVPDGVHTLVAERIGYAPASMEVSVQAGSATAVVLELRATALELPGVVVTGSGRARGAGEVYQPTSVLEGSALRRSLGATVSATIAGQPGIHEQYNGPAASQPVIRGMGGDRVLVLEDGQRTGDLYSTAADHAVAIEPLTAERIEVVRGPAGLLHGSNALGGVINVVREEVPASLPDRVTGFASLQGESVFRGVSSGAAVLAPVGPVAVRLEGAARRTDDVRTPLGVLGSSALDAVNVAGGAALITRWGRVGVSARHYTLDHGVPGEFAGEQIPGAHPGGVEIESRRTTARLEAAYQAGVGPFRSIELNAGIVRYVHDEIEGRGPDGERWIGTHFDQLSGEAGLVARHDHARGGLLREGAVGIDYRARDLRAGGSAPGLRSAQEHAFAGYIYEEIGRDPFRLQAGVRFDVIRIDPFDTSPIRVGSGDDARELPVAPRGFEAVSGSIAALWNPTPAVTLGLNAARSFRAPAVGELFSDGPHLADFSFDIGNPTLDAETGHGVDLFARIGTTQVEVEAAVFVNAVSGYIYYDATGELDPRFRRFPVFQARSHDALFRGAEGRIQWQPASRIVIDATSSFVTAERRPTRDPLPSIPPLTASATVRYERSGGFASIGWRGAAAQRRVPGTVATANGVDGSITPQLPTTGYALWDAGAGLRWNDGPRFHSVTLNLRNAFDAVWRDHLSRTKDIAPQPGRNVQLLYRIHF
jgi:iron complex outermembrane recepter protein